MLRSVLLAIACLTIFVGLSFVAAACPSGWQITTWGAVLLVAVLGERWRYQKAHGAPIGEWEKTNEEFIDPETGKRTQVFYLPQTGERRYVQVDDASMERHG